MIEQIHYTEVEGGMWIPQEVDGTVRFDLDFHWNKGEALSAFKVNGHLVQCFAVRFPEGRVWSAKGNKFLDERIPAPDYAAFGEFQRRERAAFLSAQGGIK